MINHDFVRKDKTLVCCEIIASDIIQGYFVWLFRNFTFLSFFFNVVWQIDIVLFCKFFPLFSLCIFKMLGKGNLVVKIGVKTPIFEYKSQKWLVKDIFALSDIQNVKIEFGSVKIKTTFRMAIHLWVVLFTFALSKLGHHRSCLLHGVLQHVLVKVILRLYVRLHFTFSHNFDVVRIRVCFVETHNFFDLISLARLWNIGFSLSQNGYFSRIKRRTWLYYRPFLRFDSQRHRSICNISCTWHIKSTLQIHNWSVAFVLSARIQNWLTQNVFTSRNTANCMRHETSIRVWHFFFSSQFSLQNLITHL